MLTRTRTTPLHVVDVASGKVTDVDHDDYGDITHYRWAPDSRWLTYTKLNDARFSSIYVYSLPESKSYRLTNGMTDDNEPVFDPKGRYLYFTSNRDYNLTFSAFEFNYVYTDPTRVYAAVLAADGPALLLPQSDEEKASADRKRPPAAGAEKETEGEKKPADAKAAGEQGEHKPATPANVKIDVAGFEQRVRAIPGRVGQLPVTGGGRQGRAVPRRQRGRTSRWFQRCIAQALRHRRAEGRDGPRQRARLRPLGERREGHRAQRQ